MLSTKLIQDKIDDLERQINEQNFTIEIMGEYIRQLRRIVSDSVWETIYNDVEKQLKELYEIE